MKYVRLLLIISIACMATIWTSTARRSDFEKPTGSEYSVVYNNFTTTQGVGTRGSQEGGSLAPAAVHRSS